jgi:hypothetical protein
MIGAQAVHTLPDLLALDVDSFDRFTDERVFFNINNLKGVLIDSLILHIILME